MMNILEEEDKHTEDLRKCKVLFLKNENEWMAKQKQFINLLIYKFKRIIELSEQSQNEHQIKDQHYEINKIVQQKIQQYHNLKNTQFFWEQEMNNEEFLDIIQSFQAKILKLQQEIKHRENQLQEIQQRKIKEDSFRLRKNESKWLNNIQTNRKLIQKVRSQVVQLKQKKKKLQNKIVATSQNSDQSHNNNTPIKTRRENSVTKENEMSTFEKALLVFKKKKYQNQVLQQKIKELQNKIAVRKMISQKMKKEAEIMEWKCLQGLQGGANGQIDSNYDYELSVMDKSVCLQNMSFSFDISRFIKPRQIVGTL